VALPSDQNTGLQRASEETMSGYGSSSPLNYDDEPAQVDRHVQELEDALQDRRASRASAATPGRQEHEDGEVADGARTPARAQCYIRIGAHDVELKDSWSAERDGRDWAEPRTRTPSLSPAPAKFQGRMTYDSWIAGRDERYWEEPSLPHAQSSRESKKDVRDVDARRSGRGNPSYAPYGGASPEPKEPRKTERATECKETPRSEKSIKRKRSSSRERGRYRESKRQEKIGSETEARRNNRRDDLFGTATATSHPTPLRSPKLKPQQRKPRDLQRGGNQRELTRDLSRGRSRSLDRVQAGRVGKAYQVKRTEKREEWKEEKREDEESRRVMDKAKQEIDEKLKQARERRASDMDKALE